jgi:hypothetical protein
MQLDTANPAASRRKIRIDSDMLKNALMMRGHNEEQN